MVMDSVGEYTGNLSRQLDTWVSGFDRLSCTEEDLPALEALISRFVESSAAIKAKVESVKTGVEADAWKRSEDLRTRAETTISTILEDGDSKISPVFKRNLLLIFHGPDFSDLDSDEMTYRKKGTQVRCERLRNLSSNGILSWALSFPPSTWSAGIMANDIFNCLIDDIEPHNNITWPPAIRTKLQEFWKHKVLQSSPEYARFVESEKCCYSIIYILIVEQASLIHRTSPTMKSRKHKRRHRPQALKIEVWGSERLFAQC